MRAAVLREFGKPLVVTDVPMPIPRSGETIVRVRAAGLCGSDLKVMSGKLPGVAAPVVPGHEVAGELTERVGDLAAGTRVATYVITSCGTCPSCKRGEQTVCPSAERIGFERDGGLAEYMAISTENLLPFGEALSFEIAAVAMDAVLSPWRAVRTRGAVKAGDTVLVVGAGGLGLHAIQVALALGAKVAVIDPMKSHRDAAIEQKASVAVDPAERDSLRAFAPEGFDMALEASGSPDGFRSACELVRPAGRVVCCGYQPGADYAFPSIRIALAEILVLGSRGGSLEDARDALRAVESGKIAPIVVGHGGLDDVNAMLDMLRSGEAAGRLVVTF